MASLLIFPKNTHLYQTTPAASLVGSRREASADRILRHNGAGLPFTVRSGTGIGNGDWSDLKLEAVRNFVNQVKRPLLRNVAPLYPRTSGRSGRILKTISHTMGVAMGGSRGPVLDRERALTRP